MGAARVWRTPEGWTGRRYRLGTNKEVSDTEVYAIYRALRILDQSQESGHRYAIFVDFTSAIERIRTDALGPGQRFAIATMEVCSRILARENDVTVRWAPAHYGIAGNERRMILLGPQPRGEAPRARSPTGIGGRPACRI